MARSTRAELYRKIVDQVKGNPSTILQVSRNTGINWETTRNAINTMQQLGILSRAKNKYFAAENPRKDTLLGLPLTPEQEKATKQLAKRVQELSGLNWFYQQQILVKVVQEENIENVPYGWYLNGQCTVLQSLGNAKTTKYDTTIKKVVKEYAQIPMNQLTRKLYIESGKNIYLAKTRLSNTICNKFTAESYEKLRTDLNDFMLSYTGEHVEYVNGFASILFRLMKSYPPEQLEDIRINIWEAFQSVWEMVATDNFCESVKPFYNEQVLRKHYEGQVEQLKQLAEMRLNFLNEPIKPTKDNLLKFKGIQVARSR